MSRLPHISPAVWIWVELTLAGLGVAWALQPAGSHNAWSLALILPAVAGVVYHALRANLGPAKTPEQAARDLLNQWRQINSGEPHEFRPVVFRATSAGDTAARALTAEGFRRVGDAEDVTLARRHGRRALVFRAFVGDEGVTVASLHAARAWPDDPPVANIGTEFDDGTFVMTIRSTDAVVLSSGPRVRFTRYRLDTPIPELLQLHRAAVREYLAEHPGVRPTLQSTIDDVTAGANRMQARIAAHRHEVGYITGEELIALLAARQGPRPPREPSPHPIRGICTHRAGGHVP